MCTSGAVSTRDSNGKPLILLAKSSDYRRTGNWFGIIKGNCGYDILGSNRWDIVGINAGMNRTGLAVCRTYFDYREGTLNDYSKTELPDHGFDYDSDSRGAVAAAMLERCSSVNEGITYLNEIVPIHCYKGSGQKGVSFILADSDGGLAVLESCNGQLSSKIYKNGLIARGNNGLLLFTKEQETLSKNIKKDRNERYKRMLKTLSDILKKDRIGKSKTQAIEEIKYTFSWHGPDGGENPGAICAHGICAPGARTNSSELFYTNAAMIFDVVDKQMHYVGGNPCELKWSTIEFD
jgi:hypothetical protein